MLTISDRFKNMSNSKNRDRCWHTFTHKNETLAKLTEENRSPWSLCLQKLLLDIVLNCSMQWYDRYDIKGSHFLFYFLHSADTTLLREICRTRLSLREELPLLGRWETKYQRQMSWHNRYTVTYITWPPIVDFPASGKKKTSSVCFRFVWWCSCSREIEVLWKKQNSYRHDQ